MQEKTEWLWSILPEISRTFAFTIPHLPEDVAEDLAISYAVCRVTDTIEDSALSPDHKQKTFAAFLTTLRQPRNHQQIQQCKFLLSEVSAKKEYRRLLDEIPILMNLFATLPERVQEGVAATSAEMVRGLSNSQIQRIETIEDQNRYCHYAEIGRAHV